MRYKSIRPYPNLNTKNVKKRISMANSLIGSKHFYQTVSKGYASVTTIQVGFQ